MTNAPKCLAIVVICLNKTIHEEAKEFKCEQWSKSFGERAYMRKHLKTIHEGAEKFECEKCTIPSTNGKYPKRIKKVSLWQMLQNIWMERQFADAYKNPSSRI